MLKNVKLQTKLLTIGIGITLVPLIVVSVTVLVQNKRMVRVAQQGSTTMAYDDLDHIANNTHGMCQAQHELLQLHVDQSLSVARDILNAAGEVTLAEDAVSWQATNQYTKATSQTELPQMMVGETWIGQNRDMGQISPVVDKTRDLRRTL